jgi:hypothetical protein
MVALMFVKQMEFFANRTESHEAVRNAGRLLSRPSRDGAASGDADGRQPQSASRLPP